MLRYNSGWVGAGIGNDCRHSIDDILSRYQPVFIPMSRGKRIYYKDSKRVSRLNRQYSWKLFKNIKDKQKQGLDILSYVLSCLAGDYHNATVKKGVEQSKNSFKGKVIIEKFEKAFAPIEAVSSGLCSKSVNFVKTFERISESIDKTHSKLAELNHIIGGGNSVEEQKLKQEVLNLVKETEQLSKLEISKAAKKLIALKTGLADSELAAKIYGRGKGIVIECFEHPKYLKNLATFSKSVERISPLEKVFTVGTGSFLSVSELPLLGVIGVDDWIIANDEVSAKNNSTSKFGFNTFSQNMQH